MNIAFSRNTFAATIEGPAVETGQLALISEDSVSLICRDETKKKETQTTENESILE